MAKERTGSAITPPRRSVTVKMKKATVHLLGCVKGLLSEAPLVEKAIKELEPNLIGLHIGPEELRGLNAVIDGELKETELSSYEKVYALRLSRFGEVQIPPPSLVQALRSARESDVEVQPLDMDDADYSALYTDEIGGVTIIRQSLRLKKVSRIKFDERDPASFSIHWDKAVNRLSGYRRLEAERERRMAIRIGDLSKKGGVHLHILEIERLEGIAAFLTRSENFLDKVK